ncbi:nucleotidyl transferase AbiEii/AbiGii toxin family protein [Lentibacillus sp. Marseille-P4043]|uniref:nucleotidyl transferase AbiEii/AbiGii toxin family protein n=1 Tax=Lentibacillus sp. Marseille-P4043 TaxID=2040293 RepID=UPI000D0B7B15|nr:nucleotidyl transferase AbiEii/AbiGii toxin family protein [Lentibacillus sp. Marseille-P4043]
MEEIINIQSSKEEQLRNVAEQNGEAFDSIVMLYLQERLLQRLSVSEYRNKFLLKGDLFLFSITQFKARPVKEMSFLAEQVPNDIPYIKAAFESICAISNGEDGVMYGKDNITVERIAVDYEGVHVKIPASFGNVKKELQLDIGFGDIIVPKPQDMLYPTLISVNPLQILGYSTESVIAEKFDSILSLSADDKMANLYDVYTLLTAKNFDGRVLLEAVFETFQKRGTHLEREQAVFSQSFVEDDARVKQWNDFVGQMGSMDDDLESHMVMKAISNFLYPIYQAIINENEFFNVWNCQLQEWE